MVLLSATHGRRCNATARGGAPSGGRGWHPSRWATRRLPALGPTWRRLDRRQRDRARARPHARAPETTLSPSRVRCAPADDCRFPLRSLHADGVFLRAPGERAVGRMPPASGATMACRDPPEQSRRNGRNPGGVTCLGERHRTGWRDPDSSRQFMLSKRRARGAARRACTTWATPN